MKNETVLVGEILFVIATTIIFDTLGAFAAHESQINEQAEGVPIEKSLLNFQIEALVERNSSSGCAADLKVMSDERILDPQLPAKRSNLAPLDPDKSMEFEDTRPTSC